MIKNWIIRIIKCPKYQSYVMDQNDDDDDDEKFQIKKKNELKNFILTIKTLRENTEKHSQLEMSYETASYELKKKQDDYKRLQQVIIIFILSLKKYF